MREAEFWDEGNCGPCGDDHNMDELDYALISVGASICESGVAERIIDCAASLRDGLCDYYAYSVYECSCATACRSGFTFSHYGFWSDSQPIAEGLSSAFVCSLLCMPDQSCSAFSFTQKRQLELMEVAIIASQLGSKRFRATLRTSHV